MPDPAGYSARRSRGSSASRAGARVPVIDAPGSYRAALEPLPGPVRSVDDADADGDVVHLFAVARGVLTDALVRYRTVLRPDAMVWVSRPKQSAKVPTDITEDTIRAVALPLGFVDVKVCAVDALWSGLKLVVRGVALTTRAPAGRAARAAVAKMHGFASGAGNTLALHAQPYPRRRTQHVDGRP